MYRPRFLTRGEEQALVRRIEGLEFEPIVMKGVVARRTAVRFELVQVLIQRYPPGAPIGWHRDSPAFQLVVGVSLLSEARMRFRHGPPDDRETWETWDVLLEPGSAYVLSDEVRWDWEHHVPPAKKLRYSITFRSLRDRARH